MGALKKQQVQAMQKKLLRSVNDTRAKVISITKDNVKKADKQLKRKPWKFLGIAALFSAFFGFLLGRRSK